MTVFMQLEITQLYVEKSELPLHIVFTRIIAVEPSTGCHLQWITYTQIYMSIHVLFYTYIRWSICPLHEHTHTPHTMCKVLPKNHM